MANFDGFTIDQQVPEALFEASVYDLLRHEQDIRISLLLHFRAPVQKPGPKDRNPTDLSGRRISVFERAEGRNNVWEELDKVQKVCIYICLNDEFILRNSGILTLTSSRFWISYPISEQHSLTTTHLSHSVAHIFTTESSTSSPQPFLSP